MACTQPTWRCITGCGACCRLDPAERVEALQALNPEQCLQYLAMVGGDGWCIHFDTGGRRCRIYDERPSFCRVENLTSLFGATADIPNGSDVDPDALAIACCTQQIRSEFGGRGRVMRRFQRAIRQQP
ncbi:MAG: YkgJ family cysteine cluster protein [Cyanobacteriota bacterium]